MADAALGFLLRDLREERGLSLREAAQLAGVDHAYVYRLETGAKESPSEEVLSKLIRSLKAPKREAEMLRYLAAHAETDAALVAHVRKDPTVTYEIFASVAGAAFRGTARPDYPKLIARVRRILGEEDSHG
jgi:transcriptional regulator with XRE-family HTH domain